MCWPIHRSAWTDEIWFYDYRTNIHHTLKKKPLRDDALGDLDNLPEPDETAELQERPDRAAVVKVRAVCPGSARSSDHRGQAGHSPSPSEDGRCCWHLTRGPQSKQPDSVPSSRENPEPGLATEARSTGT